MYIVFDTETTGFPKKWYSPSTDVDNWPRMVQIAWIIYDEAGKEIKRRNCIIKPEGFIIPQEAIDVHRITNEIANEKGEDLSEVLWEFTEDLKTNSFLIAHNISFDENVVGCEFFRKNVDNNLYNIRFIDTKELTVDFCQIPGSRGLKWPTLTELHVKLFGTEIIDAHDAIVDVEALAKCFFELKKLNIFGFNKKRTPLNFSKSILLPKKYETDDIKYDNSDFVHLGVHTFYSTFQAAGSADEYCKLAKKYGQKSVGITDFGNLSGAFNFFQSCKANDIKPIFGVELNINDNIGKFEERRFEGENNSLKVIIKDYEGYCNLNRLLYLSFDQGYYYIGRIKTEWLLEHHKGLFATTSGLKGKINRYISMGREDLAEDYFNELHDVFKENLLVEIELNNSFDQKIHNDFVLRMAEKHNLKVIVTNNVLYANEDDSELRDIMIAMGRKTSLDNMAYNRSRNFFFCDSKSIFEFNKNFGFNYPEWLLDGAIKETKKIADECNFVFDTKEKFPKYEATQDVIDVFKTDDVKEIITKLSHGLLKRRLKDCHTKGILVVTNEVLEKYQARLNYELEVIGNKKMLDYFMVLWELMKYCKENDVMTGPGRGSAAGCLLSWCLGITNIDPIRFGLYFERFMNPERSATPDIDVDFESGSDEKTNEFLLTKYGKERVFPVITFYTFNEKGCLKDVSRVVNNETGFSSDVYAVTKEMPEKWEEPKKFETALEEWIDAYVNAEFSDKRIVAWLTDNKIQPVIKNTIKLQGQIRSLGKHAAGIIITPSPIWYNIPVNMVSGEIVSGFQESGSGKDLSELGILKLDRLNLTTLNIIKQTIKFVKERTGNDITDDVNFLNIENPELFEELKTASNAGVFQFESEGITHLAKSINVENFNEVVATTSLYRPGPMGLQAHADYIKNKQKPEEAKYVNDKLAPLLKDTKGVLIYQEQLMFIANTIGGMTLGEGDNLRKVMDKASKIINKANSGEQMSEKDMSDKSYKEYLNLWDKFKEGAKKNGFSEDEVKDIEAWLVKYLGYSFNLSHAVSYTYLTMQTLYLKKYYPVEFYCALLNNQKGGSDKEKHKKWLYSAIQGATNKGIRVRKPSLNSGWEYTITGDNEIIMGFSSINGVGEKAFAEVIDKNLAGMTREQFFETKWSKFNKTAFEACVKAGVFDSWSESREEINFWRELSKASKKKANEMLAENRVFVPTTEEQKESDFFEVAMIDFSIMDKIAFIQKGFMEEYGKNITAVTNFESPKEWYYFYLEKIEKQKTKGGKPFYKLTVSDGASTKKLNMWDKHYEINRETLILGKFFVSRFFKKDEFLNFDEKYPLRQVSL
jgi:DNA polymerase-3 subunit alpha